MPKPVNAAVGRAARSPARRRKPLAVVHVERERLPDDVGDEQIFVAVASKSPDAMPMLPSGLPAAFTADPDSSPSSTNVPSRWLIQS